MKVPPTFAGLVADFAEAERDLAATEKALTPLLIKQAVRDAEVRLHKRYLNAIADYASSSPELAVSARPMPETHAIASAGVEKGRDGLYVPLLRILLASPPRAWVEREALKRDLGDVAGSLRARIKTLSDAGHLEKQRRRAVRLTVTGRAFAKAELAARM